jgi:hypothetical protein
VGLERERLGGDHGSLPRARRQLHRHGQRVHQGPLGENHRRSPRSARFEARSRVTSSLDDKAYDILDELARIAKELGSTVSRVAIAWVASRPGVTSTILGARTMQQLDEDNLGAADLTLTVEQIAKLDALSTPQLNLPAQMLAMGAAIVNGGTTINGKGAPAWPLTPANDDERY